MCQWIHLYQISPQDVLIFLKTFQSVFPYLSIWVDEGDMLVLGSRHPLRPDLALLSQRMAQPEVEQSLLRSNLTPSQLWKRYVTDERIVRILRKSIPLNTDDHPILEFSAPRSLFWDHSEKIIRSLYELRKIADLSGVVSETESEAP
jgi:spermidine synthase